MQINDCMGMERMLAIPKIKVCVYLNIPCKKSIANLTSTLAFSKLIEILSKFKLLEKGGYQLVILVSKSNICHRAYVLSECLNDIGVPTQKLHDLETYH